MIIDDESDIGFILGVELKFLGHHGTCDFPMPQMRGLSLFKWFKKMHIRINYLYALTKFTSSWHGQSVV
jgi:hypothetical protein